MRTRPLHLAVSLVTVGVVLGAAVQKRAKDEAPPTFEALHTAVAEDWEGGRYRDAFHGARELAALVAGKRREVIREALPDAPEGFERLEPKEAGRENPLVPSLVLGAGNFVEQRYRGDGGASVQVSVTADSPMVQMLRAWMENPAMLGPDAELVEYERCKAVLREQGPERWQLQILVGDTLVDTSVQRRDDEFVLRMFDQAAVTRLREAIER